MILQYSNNGNETYEESPSITISSIQVKDGKNLYDMMELIEKKISSVWGSPCYETRSDNLISKDIKRIKYALLSEKSRGKARVLLFDEHTVLYLLNGDGKTLKMF